MDQMGTSYYFRILILLEAKICWAAANFKSALKSFDFFERPKKERALLSTQLRPTIKGCTDVSVPNKNSSDEFTLVWGKYC